MRGEDLDGGAIGSGPSSSLTERGRIDSTGFRASSGIASHAKSEDQTVKSAARVLEIFELFCYCKRPLSISEISSQLGYPQSSTSMLVRSLASMGYLTFSAPSRLYEPSLRVPLLGRWVDNCVSPGTEILGLMEEIRARTNETVMVGQQSRWLVRYFEVLPGRRPPPPKIIRNGTCYPLAFTATGKMLLSLNKDDEIRLLLRANNAVAPNGYKPVNVEELMREIRTVRQRGYACSIPGQFPGRKGVSIALPTANLSSPLAICVAGDEADFEPKVPHILAVLRDVVSRFRADDVHQENRDAAPESQPHGGQQGGRVEFADLDSGERGQQKNLEDENQRLREIVANLMRDKQILEEMITSMSKGAWSEGR